MSWKIFITVCINTSLLLFPYNIIGCAGGDPDPYDYYVSFFHSKVSGDTEHQPFYYSNTVFLYQTQEPVDVAQVTSAEWVGYAGSSFSKKEAYDFVCRYTLKDLNNLYYHIEKRQPLKIPDSVAKNGMTNYFLQQKNLEALGYILYAKKLEPFVVGDWSNWESPERDSTKMAGLIKNGLQLMAVAKDDFVKLRYAYQLTRLAHYSGRPADCIKYYNEFVNTNTSKSILHELALGLKAGAELRFGNKKEAAYLFSKLFSNSNIKKVSNYMSFDFSTSRFDEKNRRECLALCKNKMEKANMLGLFALGSNKNELAAIKQIYQLAPDAPVLQVLVTREVNKLEENYFTPSLSFQQGAKKAYINYTEIDESSAQYIKWKEECMQLSDFCKAANPSKNKGFYMLAAAHTAMIAGNVMPAKNLLQQAKSQSLTSLQQDQLAITDLLLTINSSKKIDQQFEKDIMPSVLWFDKKAKTDVEFARFYRRLFIDILAAKYKEGKDDNSFKSILCGGVADHINSTYNQEGYGYYGQTLYSLRRDAPATDVERLIKFLESKNLNEFEKFLVKNAAFNKDDVNDIAGTAWLRVYNFAEAEKWFKKVPVAYYKEEPFKTYLAANPFADLLLDTHRPTRQDTAKYTKLSFTQKMLKLEKELAASTDKEKKAGLYYELAKGYYHMSYWGNSWLLVEYGWSGSESEYDQSIDIAKTRRNTDYYQVKKAKQYYLQALANTMNKNFQAKCIYMAAKCDQKQVGSMPWYSSESDTYQSELKSWLIDFDKRNSYFSQLTKNFNSTPFYKEAFNTCSYLKDFVKIKK